MLLSRQASHCAKRSAESKIHGRQKTGVLFYREKQKRIRKEVWGTRDEGEENKQE
jgi:hypothetical protein